MEATPIARFDTKRQSSFASQSTVAKKQTLFACQRFVGKPMTRIQAQQKLDTNAAFKGLASQAGSNSKDLIANAIAFEFGTRLRSCVEESTGSRTRRRRSTKSEL